MLQSMGFQRAGHDSASDQQQHGAVYSILQLIYNFFFIWGLGLFSDKLYVKLWLEIRKIRKKIVLLEFNTENPAQITH